MKQSSAFDMLSPGAVFALERLGKQIEIARKRRHMTQAEVGARAGLTDKTVRKLESGSPGSSLGTLAAVLDVFGLEAQLASVARSDPEGEKLAEVQLIKRVRPRRRIAPDS